MPIAAVLLAVAGVIQIGASICLLFNKQVVVCALALALMVLLINVSLHDFWNVYESVNAERETQNFFKNTGSFAGLLLLASIGMQQLESAKPAASQNVRISIGQIKGLS